MKTQVATCGVCDEPIYLDIDEETPADRLLRQLRDAEAQHLQKHPGPVLALYALRQRLDRLSPCDRAMHVRRVYRALLELWGDYDQRGDYSVDEALGSASMYRLWADAEACSYRRCRHQP